jgi:hypothetical protein
MICSKFTACITVCSPGRTAGAVNEKLRVPGEARFWLAGVGGNPVSAAALALPFRSQQANRGLAGARLEVLTWNLRLVTCNLFFGLWQIFA